MGCDLWPFRRVMRAAWYVLLVVVVVGFPALVWSFHAEHYSEKMRAWFSAGVFVLLTLPVTFYEVAMHLEYYTRPDLQKHVIRIHWMVPFYSLNSWLALRFIRARLFIDPFRECYEAYVIYSFYSYLCVFLDTELGSLEDFLAMQPTVGHMWGFQYIFRDWRMGTEFLWECKKGVLGYVILRPLTALAAMGAKAVGIYHDGEVTLAGVWFYTGLINSISQCWAIYCLIMFYRATKHELKPIHPVAKFLLIKSIVFLTYWQSLMLAFAVEAGWINTSFTMYNAEDVAAGVQELLICIEMFLAALVFAYVFPPKDYMDPSAPSAGFFNNLKSMFDMRDVMRDVTDVVDADVSMTKERVANLTSRVVHTSGLFLKGPRDFFKWRRWRKGHRRHRRSGEDHLDSEAPLLRLYESIDWSLTLPTGLEQAIRREEQGELDSYAPSGGVVDGRPAGELVSVSEPISERGGGQTLGRL
ncbi:unnamed protein product [Ostreobium quekettii]|uniref:Uncharacterized protein n=1 Tax=Ostreobium quekettii TaxID=121088 RepID=A0A8S1IQ17_9CHLO|nr:unnamed protein product [Ostreobium quekettii]|eukprot:evm.model.scf_51.12 EVM.evm.TU.scf_51.12   scf_51:94820-101933(+)